VIRRILRNSRFRLCSVPLRWTYIARFDELTTIVIGSFSCQHRGSGGSPHFRQILLPPFGFTLVQDVNRRRVRFFLHNNAAPLIYRSKVLQASVLGL
jgi:hypothetical protein